MPSKRSAQKDHKCKDSFKQDCQGCWERRLKKMKLTVNRGRKLGTEMLTYGHMIERFGEFEGAIVFDPPTGERLENEEWPISLL